MFTQLIPRFLGIAHTVKPKISDASLFICVKGSRLGCEIAKAGSKAIVLKRKTFLLLGMLLAILVVTPVFMIVSSSRPIQPRNPSTSFACYSLADNQTFAIMAEVNLMDGMNQEEATNIALKVLLREADYEGYTVQDFRTRTQPKGENWTVKLDIVYSRVLNKATKMNFEGGVTWSGPTISNVQESFNMTINPNAQTVTIHPVLLEAD